MPDLIVSWSDYHEKIERLAAQIYESDWEFNQIICIAKGGLRVGDLLCRLFDRPLAILSASSYSGPQNRQRGEIQFSRHLAMTTEYLGDRVLLVDDLVDSGKSLQATIQWLQERYQDEMSELRTATLWYKSCSIVTPDYYVDYLADDPWIRQPFEYYEQTTPDAIAAKYRSLASDRQWVVGSRQ